MGRSGPNTGFQHQLDGCNYSNRPKASADIVLSNLFDGVLVASLWFEISVGKWALGMSPISSIVTCRWESK